MRVAFYWLFFLVTDSALATLVAANTSVLENLPSPGAIQMFLMFMVFGAIVIFLFVLIAGSLIDLIKWLVRRIKNTSSDNAPK